MKNILFITNSLSFGGAAKMLVFIANSLSERGHCVSIANLKSTVNVTDYERPVNENITIFRISSKNKFETIRDLVKIGKQHKTDIIIGFTSFPNLYAKIVGSMLHIPSIMSERGDPSRTKGKNKIKNFVFSFIINRSKGGVFQTDGAMAYYGKGLQKRGIVIPNPIFIKGEIPTVKDEEREKTVVSVGRLDNLQKRYDVMLGAFKIFSEKHPDYTLKLYGRGSDEEQIERWAEELDILDKVKFMGLTTQPMQDIAKDGMFLITSDFEGISNSLLEAMAVGLPCVSTDHTPGGARLLIKHGENGLLAPVEDKNGLAECMCRFANDTELASKCGNNAKDVVNRFAPHRIIDMWENYIINLCK